MPDPADSYDEFLAIDDVAAWLHITVRHVRRLVAENRIPNHKIGGRVRLRRSEINRWLEGNGRGPTLRDHGQSA
jgi:excisionase family DNA binding protein